MIQSRDAPVNVLEQLVMDHGPTMLVHGFSPAKSSDLEQLAEDVFKAPDAALEEIECPFRA
jgi:hypothetical protein